MTGRGDSNPNVEVRRPFSNVFIFQATDFRGPGQIALLFPKVLKGKELSGDGYYDYRTMSGTSARKQFVVEGFEATSKEPLPSTFRIQLRFGPNRPL